MRTTTALVLVLPALFGFSRCGALVDPDPAPEVTGTWDVEYEDTQAVTIEIGGAVYTAELGLQGGTVEIDHEGEPFTFELDCASEDVQCPSEIWPEEVELDQRVEEYPHRMWMIIPGQECETEPVEPLPEECGEDTHNPDCLPVCGGELIEEDQEVFGLISDAGDEFELYLGASVASNGVNCALLGVSRAVGNIVSTGTSEDGDWAAEEMTDGRVIVGYTGGCLWADDVDGDEELEALVLGASLTFESSFSAVRNSKAVF